MKVLVEPKPRVAHITCERCGAELEVTPKDSSSNLYHVFDCLHCGYSNFVDKPDWHEVQN
jgi:predicted nucleic-acid-binding Zn-ribbon protein